MIRPEEGEKDAGYVRQNGEKMKLTRKIGQHEITVHVAPSLAPLAEDLLTTLAELDARGPVLQAGSTIGFGWSTLTLEAKDDFATKTTVAGPSEKSNVTP